MKTTLTFALAVLLLLPAHAAARSLYGMPPDAWQRQALVAAEQKWHPACGAVTIAFDPTPPIRGAELWGGWAFAGECVIHLPTSRLWLGYPDFCQVVLHEAGHVAGYGHSARGIMRAETLVGYSHDRIDGRLAKPHWTGIAPRCLPSVTRK